MADFWVSVRLVDGLLEVAQRLSTRWLVVRALSLVAAVAQGGRRVSVD